MQKSIQNDDVLHFQEGNEMKIKSDIRRLNQTSFNKFEEDTDEDERVMLSRKIICLYESIFTKREKLLTIYFLKSQNLEYVSPQQLDHQDHANRNLAYDEVIEVKLFS